MHTSFTEGWVLILSISSCLLITSFAKVATFTGALVVSDQVLVLHQLS